jgi:hypothetical protein
MKEANIPEGILSSKPINMRGIDASARKFSDTWKDHFDPLRLKELEEKKLNNIISDEELAELYGLRIFPNNPRGAELRKKEALKTISEEDRAELIGLYMFPDNPEGAELRRREVLKILNEKDKQGYYDLCKNKHRQKHYSQEVIGLLKAAESGDPNVELVIMNDGKVIEVKPDDPEKIIITTSLGGCYATLVYTEHENGIRHAMLTHYDPLSLSDNTTKYRRLARQYPLMAESRKKIAVYVMMADELRNQREGIGLKYVLDNVQLDGLRIALQANFGSEIDFIVQPYSTQQTEWAKDQGILLMKLPPKDKGRPNYRTWFSEGEF